MSIRSSNEFPIMRMPWMSRATVSVLHDTLSRAAAPASALGVMTFALAAMLCALSPTDCDMSLTARPTRPSVPALANRGLPLQQVAGCSTFAEMSDIFELLESGVRLYQIQNGFTAPVVL